MTCQLCKIANQEYRIFYKDKFCFGIVNKHMMKKGHVMVLPLRHVTKLNELSKEESKAIFDLIGKLEPVIHKKYGEDALVVLNRGKHATQPHLHFHIIPSKGNMRYVISNYEKIEVGKEAKIEKLKAVRDEIKSLL